MEKLKILIITGNLSPMHRYRRVHDLLRQVLEATGRFQVFITEEAKGVTAETLSDCQLAFINYDGWEKVVEQGRQGRTPWHMERTETFGETTTNTLLDFVRNGGGAFFYHSGVCLDENFFGMELRRLMGSVCVKEKYKPYRELGYTVDMAPGTLVAEGIADHWKIADDDLFNSVELLPGAELTASIHDPVNEREIPVAWCNSYGKGRVFCCALGHQEDTIRRLDFVRMLVRGCDWAACGRVEAPMPDRDSGSNWMKGWPWYYCDGCGRGL